MIPLHFKTRFMKYIGNLIEEEVRRQQLNITEFADMIHCGRNNVYDIFKRNNIDIQLLATISKVLKHNYFQDLADDPELVGLECVENEKELKNRRAVSQFLNVMPDVLSDLGMSPTITFPQLNDKSDVPLPDVGLPDYNIVFTIGERLYERAKKKPGKLLDVKPLKSKNNIVADVWTNKLRGSVMVDVKLDYKTKEEWHKTMRFVKREFLQKGAAALRSDNQWEGNIGFTDFKRKKKQ